LEDNFKIALFCFFPTNKHLVPAARHNLEPKKGLISTILTIENNDIFFKIVAEEVGNNFIGNFAPE